MNENLRCCICDTAGSPPFHVYGGRAYCDRHFALVSKPHSGFWRSAMAQIISMATFAVVVALVAGALPPLGSTTLFWVGLLLAIVPTALWLLYFYQQDRLEPEPKTKIAGVFVLALLLTETIGLRLIDKVFLFREWTTINRETSLLASILIIGFTLETIKYVAVRALVYATDEFDERMDGVIYGSAAGLGVATLLNLHLIVDNQGVALAPGVINVVTTALAHASFGGVLGYFMAQAKFEHKPLWWVPLGLVVAATLNGLFTWLIDEVSVAGLQVEPWRSLVLGVIVALATFGVLVALMRRANALTMEAT